MITVRTSVGYVDLPRSEIVTWQNVQNRLGSLGGVKAGTIVRLPDGQRARVMPAGFDMVRDDPDMRLPGPIECEREGGIGGTGGES
jgi:hypothetical protein